MQEILQLDNLHASELELTTSHLQELRAVPAIKAMKPDQPQSAHFFDDESELLVGFTKLPHTKNDPLTQEQWRLSVTKIANDVPTHSEVTLSLVEGEDLCMVAFGRSEDGDIDEAFPLVVEALCTLETKFRVCPEASRAPSHIGHLLTPTTVSAT